MLHLSSAAKFASAPAALSCYPSTSQEAHHQPFDDKK